MTDDMLRLARAVYPDREWVRLNDRDVWATEDYPHGIRRDGTQFDPANNADQFCDVLAWLLSNHEAAINGDDVTVYIGNQQYAYTPHDGTASGIRRAVVEAAMRAVG